MSSPHVLMAGRFRNPRLPSGPARATYEELVSLSRMLRRFLQTLNPAERRALLKSRPRWSRYLQAWPR